MFRNRSASLSASHNLPVESYLKSIRYHFVLLMLTCPQVVCAAPEKYQDLTGLASPFLLLEMWEMGLSAWWLSRI